MHDLKKSAHKLLTGITGAKTTFAGNMCRRDDTINMDLKGVIC